MKNIKIVTVCDKTYKCIETTDVNLGDLIIKQGFSWAQNKDVSDLCKIRYTNGNLFQYEIILGDSGANFGWDTFTNMVDLSHYFKEKCVFQCEAKTVFLKVIEEVIDSHYEYLLHNVDLSQLPIEKKIRICDIVTEKNNELKN